MTRIERRFAQLKKNGRKAFIPYITAGDPSLKATQSLVIALEKAGADLIELGVPFSDPIADGPVIQRATERALKNGVTLRQVLELVGEIRKESEIPLILFSYYNPLLNYGLEALARDALRAGLDGVLASDLTVEESSQFRGTIQNAGLNSIFLVAPTSSEARMKRIAQASTGFLYAVSRTGVTGETRELASELGGFLRILKSHTALPIAAGFGISKPEHLHTVWELADGAIVGSALVRAIEENMGRSDFVERISGFARWLRSS